jgi:hypothetical protein
MGSVLVVALLAGSMLFGGDDKPAAKVKKTLPKNWSKLGLTPEQKTKIQGIQVEYQTKISALKKQIEELQKKEHTEMVKVLTKEQKAKLTELTLGEENPKEEKKPAPDK